MAKLEFEENSVDVVLCAAGHVTISSNYAVEHDDWNEEDYGYCQQTIGLRQCGMPLVVVTAPEALQRIAERQDTEKAHKVADEAMYQRMKQLDPEFAAWYQAQRGGW